MGQKVMNQASNDTLEISQFILLWQPRECCIPREKRISCRSWAGNDDIVIELPSVTINGGTSELHQYQIHQYNFW